MTQENGGWVKKTPTVVCVGGGGEEGGFVVETKCLHVNAWEVSGEVCVFVWECNVYAQLDKSEQKKKTTTA